MNVKRILSILPFGLLALGGQAGRNGTRRIVT
jgi:hypothetical protein